MKEPSGRSPCGERGLKLTAVDAGRRIRLSLPVRGAWIEILTDCVECWKC